MILFNSFVNSWTLKLTKYKLMVVFNTFQPEHKIQSQGEKPLHLSLELVPKMLKPLVKDWVPDAYVISFKVSTSYLFFDLRYWAWMWELVYILHTYRSVVMFQSVACAYEGVVTNILLFISTQLHIYLKLVEHPLYIEKVFFQHQRDSQL